MTGTRNFRPPFDPRCTFVWTRGAIVSGQPVARHDPVDPASVTPRKMRQLYDTRWIELAPDSPEPQVKRPRRDAVGPTDLLKSGLDGQPEKASPARRAIRRVTSRRAA